MDKEIELKLVVPKNARQLIEEKLLPELPGRCTTTENRLSNFYYDTAEHRFRQLHIGFRVRGVNGCFEQTLKTAGHVVAGLHQRPEFNVPLTDNKPELSLFERSIWPADIQPDVIQDKLEVIFTTHFTRVAYLLDIDGTQVEMAFDQGCIEANQQQLEINEVELELKQGDSQVLFDLAAQCAQLMPVRFSNLSKSARGYNLVTNTSLQRKPMPEFLPLRQKDNTETAFCKAIKNALQHWQHHEEVFLQSQSEKALIEMHKGMRLMVQAVALYLPVLQCPQLLDFHKQLLALRQQWNWLDELKSLLALRSKKGPFSKRMQKHPEVLGYLHGRCVGMLQQHPPTELMVNHTYIKVLLQAGVLLHQCPWRNQSDSYLQPVIAHVRGWLSQDWQAVMQIMPPSRQLSCEHYMSIELTLRYTLTNGFMLAGLFDNQREQFRAPWLDVLYGIEELRALLLLQQALKDADIEDRDKLFDWSEGKMQNLLNAMEQSRKAGLQAEAYW